MGYRITQTPDQLKSVTLPDGSSLYDLLYSTGPNGEAIPKVGNSQAIDYVSEYGNSYLEVDTYNTTQTNSQSGYTSVAGETFNTTRYQLEVGVANDSSVRHFNVTFDPRNTESLNRTLINFPGSGGWGAAGANGYGLGKYDQYCLQNDDGYVVINKSGSGGGSDVLQSIYDVSEQIQSNYGDASADHRYVISGASAGAKTTVDMAEVIITNRGNDHTPIDIMLLDGADGDYGACGRFVQKMSNNSVVRNEMINTGSIIYAYESADPNMGGMAGANNAIQNLGTLADQGMIVVEKDPSNGGYVYHSGMNSNELMLSNGESRKVVNESFSPTNESNQYNLILPGKDSSGKYHTTVITEKQLSDYTTFRKAIGSQNKVDYLQRINTNDYSGAPQGQTREKTPTVSESNTIAENETSQKTETPKLPTTKTPDSTTTEERKTSIDYNSIVDSSNEVIQSINQTTFRDMGRLNYQFCNDSTASFPESINKANSFLFATSGNLLNNVTTDMKNIGTMLNSYAALDQDLANEADSLFGPGGMAGQAGSYNITGANYADTDGLLISLSTDLIQNGKAGKISVSDINGMLNGNQLGGIVGDCIRSERSDAAQLKASIEGLINNPNIDSPDWSAMKSRLEQYSSSCDDRIKATEILEEAYLDSLKLVNDYLDPDDYLDDGEIPSYESKKTAAENRVTALEAQNAQLSQVKLIEYTVYDPETGEEYTYSNAGEYYAAQAQIAANNTEIESLTADITEYSRILDKLYGLPGILNKANGIVDNAVNEVNQMYANGVNDLNPKEITPYQADSNPIGTPIGDYTGGINMNGETPTGGESLNNNSGDTHVGGGFPGGGFPGGGYYGGGGDFSGIDSLSNEEEEEEKKKKKKKIVATYSFDNSIEAQSFAKTLRTKYNDIEVEIVGNEVKIQSTLDKGTVEYDALIDDVNETYSEEKDSLKIFTL